MSHTRTLLIALSFIAFAFGSNHAVSADNSDIAYKPKEYNKMIDKAEVAAHYKRMAMKMRAMGRHHDARTLDDISVSVNNLMASKDTIHKPFYVAAKQRHFQEGFFANVPMSVHAQNKTDRDALHYVVRHDILKEHEADYDTLFQDYRMIQAKMKEYQDYKRTFDKYYRGPFSEGPAQPVPHDDGNSYMIPGHSTPVVITRTTEKADGSKIREIPVTKIAIYGEGYLLKESGQVPNLEDDSEVHHLQAYNLLNLNK